MFRRFHHVDQVPKSGVSGQAVVEVLPGNFANGCDFDMALIESVAAADFDTRSFPDTNAGGHFATLDVRAKFFGEEHARPSSFGVTKKLSGNIIDIPGEPLFRSAMQTFYQPIESPSSLKFDPAR